MTKIFKDKYGNIWELITNEKYLKVFSSELGFGVWDNGKGLTEI